MTGSRAEYGLLFPVLSALSEDPKWEVQLIVTGMHLSPEFGLTYREILDDGFHIADKLEILLSSDTPVSISKAIGLGIISMAESLDRLKPDWLLLLGDRFELLAAATAAMNARIPVAHIHGGEATEGLIDESIRHAVTKRSFVHFTSTKDYRRRVIQLGEEPDRVFSVGAPGLDNVKKTDNHTPKISI